MSQTALNGRVSALTHLTDESIVFKRENKVWNLNRPVFFVRIKFLKNEYKRITVLGT